MPKGDSMTSDEWLSNRTTDELLRLDKLLEIFAPKDSRVKYRFFQVQAELEARATRQREFMDRLDGLTDARRYPCPGE